MNYVPYVLEQTENGERVSDIYSKLLTNRIILLNGEIDDHVSNTIIAQLLHLDSLNNDDIFMYINSPGGVVTSGLGILDCMNFIKSDIQTICIGQAASMGSLLLSAGTRDKRISLENSRIMIHQPLGGAQGQASDIQIQAEEILYLKRKLNNILHVHTGKTIKQIEKDTDRDNFLSADDALKYGLIDKIIKGNSNKYQYNFKG